MSRHNEFIYENFHNGPNENVLEFVLHYSYLVLDDFFFIWFRLACNENEMIVLIIGKINRF